MKVAVSSSGRDVDSPVDARFGRAPYFLIVDTESFDCQVVPNTQNLQAPPGSGNPGRSGRLPTQAGRGSHRPLRPKAFPDAPGGGHPRLHGRVRDGSGSGGKLQTGEIPGKCRSQRGGPLELAAYPKTVLALQQPGNFRLFAFIRGSFQSNPHPGEPVPTKDETHLWEVGANGYSPLQ